MTDNNTDNTDENKIQDKDLAAAVEQLNAAAKEKEYADDVVAEAEAMADSVGAADVAEEEEDVVKADVDNDALDEVLVKRVLEAAILVADHPLKRDAMLLLFEEEERPSRNQLTNILEQMQADCEKRGIELREVASGYRFQAKKEVGPWVSRMWQEKPQRYSRAIMETLALIAYRQPITRGEIEEIRGVSVNTQIVRTLLERNWVRVVGHRDVPGRPAMYATTKQFLDYFDLKSLQDLPPLSEIRDLDKLNEELQLEQGDEQGQSEVATHEEAEQAGQQSMMDAMEQDNEPEIDESTLMSLEQVDSVLTSFEDEFRKKPAKDKEQNDAQDEQASADSSNVSAEGEQEKAELPNE